MSSPTDFTCETFIEASPETVFSYFTEQDKVAQWLGESVEIDASPGGSCNAHASSGIGTTGEFKEITPHTRIVFTWGGMGEIPEGSTTVEIDLQPENGGTNLSLRHYGFADEQNATQFKQGWPSHVFPLLQRVIGGEQTIQRCFRKTPDKDEEAA